MIGFQFWNWCFVLLNTGASISVVPALVLEKFEKDVYFIRKEAYRMRVFGNEVE
jgi:hypothetical protein